MTGSNTDINTARVLVANRGEIALRIIRSVQDTGREAIAVYADQDIDNQFVDTANEAYALDGTTASDTYLDASKIINLAKRSAATAIHPGYGFLAENAEFAQAVIDAGLTWIGPSPAAIETLGDGTYVGCVNYPRTPKDRLGAGDGSDGWERPAGPRRTTGRYPHLHHGGNG